MQQLKSAQPLSDLVTVTVLLQVKVGSGIF